MSVEHVTLGEFISREGSYFMNRKRGEQRGFTFEDSILPLTRRHIIRDKASLSGYYPHPSAVSSLEDAQELHLAKFAKIATGLEGYISPPILNRSVIATFLVDDASCSDLSPCHGCATESPHHSTGLETGGIVT